VTVARHDFAKSKIMKNKKIIAGIFIIVGLFGLLYLTGKNKVSNPQNEIVKVNSQQENAGNKLIASEKLYDFGAISMKDGLVRKVFKVSNPGEQDINLEKISTSCMCTVVYIIEQDGNKKGPYGMPGHGIVPKANEIIKIGEMRDIEVVYDPNAHGPAGVGMINRLVYLEDSNGNKLQFEIKANVTP